ncbi:MAG TPA: ATP-binding protein, partial [Terrimicrobiaceae bacterium]|nr:ATP-binding protein [Terrimicrobiaceae bacterium]
IESHARELKRQRAVALSLMEDARRSEQDAERASQAKTTFLAMMSHEIRTPLNGVIGFTDLLLAEGLPDRQSEIALAIRTCGETLLSLISDILDITKIESGRLVLDPVNGNVEECLHAVQIAFEQMARRNRIAFSLEIEPSCPRWLRLDFNRIRQILFNLVGNAVKFTTDGSIRIRAWSERSAEGALSFHCSVQDSGTGIPPGEVQGIFEPFLQGEGARKAAVGGSGLGLTICRRLVEAMGGAISVESQPGKGSCFQFHVRTSEGVEEPILPILENQPASIGANVRFLVVDDVATNVRLAVSLFERLGFQADAAAHGREAVEMARAANYALIVMDILMPELNGYEAARQIRIQEADLGLPRAWIVALTADAFVENRRKCADVGMDDFMTKPLRINDLSKCIARWQAGISALQENL